MENRVNWKNTIGKPELRKGEYNLWGYHSTNGFGYHEFLQYCEDMGAKAMFVAMPACRVTVATATITTTTRLRC